MQKQLQRIALFGYFGAWNLGDEAVVGVLLENIRSRLPFVQVHAVCLVPENTRVQHGIPSYPLRRISGSAPTADGIDATPDNTSFWQMIRRRLSVIAPKEILFLWKAIWALRGTDLIVVGGSGQLIDNEGGPWNHPYNHFKWSILAKIVGARFAFVSVGAGPLNTWLGRRMISASLSLASYCSFRDEGSLSLASRIGAKGRMLVFPDQAFSITPAPEKLPVPGGERLTVGVAPMAYCDPRHWNEHDEPRYHQYQEKIVSFIRWLQQQGHNVLLFHTQVNGDDRSVREVLDLLGKDAAKTEVQEVGWYTDALKAIARTDLVVASRFHAIVFSYVSSRPCIGISYDPKIDNVMSACEQAEYVLDIDSFTVPDLIRKFESLQLNRERNRGVISKNVAVFKTRVQQQYDSLFGEEIAK